MQPYFCQAPLSLSMDMERLAWIALIREKMKTNAIKTKHDRHALHVPSALHRYQDSRPSNRHPDFTILPGAAEGDESLQEVGEAFFPGALAGDAAGQLAFGEG